MGISLLPHNQKAYDSVKTLFNRKNRAAIIHPTGTGKGHIARKLIEDNQDKKIIYISPSLAINDRLEEDLEKYGIDKSNVEIFTYQKLIKMTKEEIKALEAEYIILDEFHHCGAKEWGSVINDLLSTHQKSKVLGLSATPLRYTANGVRDMAEELFENCIASEMSLEAAIAEGILNEPTYITSIFAYEEIIEDLEKKIENYESNGSKIRGRRKEMAEKELAELKKQIHKAITSLPDVLENSMQNKSGKYIVFCSSIEDMKKKIDAAPELFKKVNPNMQIRQVSSDEADVNKNEKTLQEFADDKDPNSLKLLFCVNMLNEGYHLEDLDGGIMMRSTTSPTLYTQQFGRIVSAGKEDKTILIDLVNNIDAIENIVRFYDNLSRERRIKHQSEKTKKFTITSELRHIGDVVRKIEGLVSRRSNNIEVNFLNKLGLTYDEAKNIIESSSDELYRGKKSQYDGEEVLEEKDTLNLFYQLRTAKIKLSNITEYGTSEYDKREKDYYNIRDRIIVENIGLAKWMLKNIPELQELEFSTEEDKLQTAMKFLIEAVDTYNPKLKTRDNTSIRFDQYLLVFLQAGMQREVTGYEQKKCAAEISEIREKIINEKGNEATTDDEIAEILLQKTLLAMYDNNGEYFKNHPFSDLLREEIKKYKNRLIALEERKESHYPTKQRKKTYEIREEIENGMYAIVKPSIWSWKKYEIEKDLLAITRFQIRRESLEVQTIESYEQISDFEIDTYDFEDGESVQPVGDSFVSEGVYLEKKEPYAKDAAAVEAYINEVESTNNRFLKVDLEKVLRTLNAWQEDAIRLKFELGSKKDDLGNDEKVSIKYGDLKRGLMHLRRPIRSKCLKNYIQDDVPGIIKKSKTYSNETTVNYDGEASYDILAGEYENVRLSEIIEDEEIYEHLNSMGLSSLDELLQATEEQLKTILECPDEYVDEIKAILEGYGLELSEEENPDLIFLISGDADQKEKAETLKGLMQKRREQEDEIKVLESSLEESKDERED